jgi:hypothetical protein
MGIQGATLAPAELAGAVHIGGDLCFDDAEPSAASYRS